MNHGGTFHYRQGLRVALGYRLDACSARVSRPLVLMGVIVGAFILSAAYAGPSHCDDVFIYMRYADHLLRNSAPEYNVGEQSNGITSGLLLAIMVEIAMR